MDVVIAKPLSLLTLYKGEDLRLDRYTWEMPSSTLQASKVFAPRVTARLWIRPCGELWRHDGDEDQHPLSSAHAQFAPSNRVIDLMNEVVRSSRTSSVLSLRY